MSGGTDGTSGRQRRRGQKQRIIVVCIVVIDDIIVIGVIGKVIDVRELVVAVVGVHVVIIRREKTVGIVQGRKQVQIVIRDAIVHVATLRKELIHRGGIQRWVDLNTGIRSRLRHFVRVRFQVIVCVVQVHLVLVCAS